MIKNNLKRIIMTVFFAGTIFTLSSCGKAGNSYKEAMKYMNEGKYEKSVKSFESAIKANPDRAEYYIGYGMALNYMGKYDDAIKEFDKAVQDVENKISKQNNKQLYYGKAIAYYGLNDYEKAVSLCDDAIKINQVKDIDPKLNILKAAALQLSGDEQSAIDIYIDVIKENDENTEAYLKLGDMYNQAGDYDAACETYNKAIKADKKCYDAYFGLYNTYMNQNDTDDAKKALEKVINLDNNDKEELMQKGKAYYYMSDYDNAYSKLELAAKNGNLSAVYYQGMIKMSQKDYSGAIETFEKYLKDSTRVDIPEVYNQLAGCYIETGDMEAAQRYIEEGLSLGNTSAVKMLRKNQIILYEKSGKFAKARKEAKEYIKSYPSDEGMVKELKFINTRIAAKKKLRKGN